MNYVGGLVKITSLQCLGSKPCSSGLNKGYEIMSESLAMSFKKIVNENDEILQSDKKRTASYTYYCFCF